MIVVRHTLWLSCRGHLQSEGLTGVFWKVQDTVHMHHVHGRKFFWPALRHSPLVLIDIWMLAHLVHVLQRAQGCVKALLRLQIPKIYCGILSLCCSGLIHLHLSWPVAASSKAPADSCQWALTKQVQRSQHACDAHTLLKRLNL